MFAGFSADVQVGFGAEQKVTSGAGVVTTQGKSGDATAFGLNYVNGPLAVKFGTETVSSTSKDMKVAGQKVLAASATAVTTDLKNTAIGASYDLGMAKLFFVNTSATQGADATKAKFDTNNFGVRVPMGSITLNANYSTGKALLPGQAVKADMEGMQLSIWYALNKETTIYGVYGTEQVKHSIYANTPKQDTFLAGLRYKF